TAPGKVRQSLFQLMMRLMMTTNQMGRRTAEPGFRQCTGQRFKILRVIGQTQIIITAERQQWHAIRDQLRLLGTGNQTASPVETGLFPLFNFVGKITHYECTLNQNNALKPESNPDHNGLLKPAKRLKMKAGDRFPGL